MRTPRVISLFNAATGVQAGTRVYVGDACRAALRLTRAGHTAGSNTWSIKGGFGTPDQDPTMYNYSMAVQDAANSNVQNLLRAQAPVQSANGSLLMYIDLDDFPVSHLQIGVTVATDGNASADLILFDEE